MRTLFLVCAVLLLSASGLAECPTADLTGDCYVGLADLAVMASQWESEPNMADFSIMANQWMTGTPGPQGMVFIDIPSGTFQMGDSFDPEGASYELPVHTVTLDSFKMSKYTITNQQYCDYLNSAYPAEIQVANGIVYASSDTLNHYPYFSTSSAPAGSPDFGPYSQIDFNDPDFSVRTKGGRGMIDDPVVCVSWYGAKAFCDYYGYSLPSEAQWEYGARGGLSGRRFPWGNRITHSQANYRSSSSYSYDISPTIGYHPTWDDGIMPYTSPVGSFPASVNGYGLHDMEGNVWEWCADWYSSTYYSISPGTNPTGPATGSTRVIRGGSWYHTASSCRISSRGSSYGSSRRGFTSGFRVCLD